MFCDLVGSTALSAQLDPEELREVVRGYQETCTEVIQRYDGHIAQHLGDGLLVYFGYPLAHEDDAARAVRTGLEIIEVYRNRSPLLVARAFLRVGRGGRVGQRPGSHWHSRRLSSHRRDRQQREARNTCAGRDSNIAARIQGTANPDEVVISAATYRLVEGLFACEERGNQH